METVRHGLLQCGTRLCDTERYISTVRVCDTERYIRTVRYKSASMIRYGKHGAIPSCEVVRYGLMVRTVR